MARRLKKRKKKGSGAGGGKFEESLHPRSAGGKFQAKGSVGKTAWDGTQMRTRTQLSKLESGAIGERAAINYLRKIGIKDARALNIKGNNYPIDLAGDHMAIEVKAGLVSNGKGAQQWRATIGQPGKKEQAWLKKASREQKARWNEAKGQAILNRKNRALKELEKKSGMKLKPRTLTMIINPDTKTADVFFFKGFHRRIAWNSRQARAAYVRTVRI